MKDSMEVIYQEKFQIVKEIYYHNYITFLKHINYIISVKTLRDYILLEKKNMNVILDEMLSFDSLISNFNLPIILINVLDKSFLCYENYQLKFVDNIINMNSGK